tara:strand:+ start:4352 stop:4765 length:414 start_codon:yes stop_codon:yes gene_type:complete
MKIFMEFIYKGMLFISLVLIYFAYKNWTESRELVIKGIKTTAKVVQLITVTDNEGNTFRPVFQYTDTTNNKITFESEISSSPSAYNVGDNVHIVYSKSNNIIKIISFWSLYRWSILLLVMASPLLIIGVGHLLYTLF